MFCDSLEVYESDWTDDFLDAFKARRGYDLRPLLPALVLDAGPATAGDPPRLGPDADRAASTSGSSRRCRHGRAQHGTRFRIQGYGIPPATISSNAGVDLPEGEGAQWKTRARVALGGLHRPPLRPAGHLVGDLDVAALAGRSGPRRST